nr:efflux RND transporter periplasmic adaptor subunit [Lachnospiraceae bacterium]
INGLDDDVKTAKEELKEAKNNLKAFKKYVKGNVIRAEYSGTITSLELTKNDTIDEGDEIASYMDADSISMSVDVSEEDVMQIKTGDSVYVELSAYPDEKYNATVSSISQESSGTSTVSYPVVVSIDGDTSKIYSGMSGKATFIQSEVKDVLYVSNKAIITDGDDSYVLIKQKDGSSKKTKVTTGFTDGHNVEITEGVEEGDTLYIESLSE